MKSVVRKSAFAVLLVLILCTIAAYHIEQLMMAKVTVSAPQDEIVRGTFCEGTVLPLSSLTMRDGSTGVYMIDYVEGVFGQESKALVEVGEHIFLRKVGKFFIEQSAVAFQPAFIGGARARKYQISVRLVKKPQSGAQSFGIVFHDLFDIVCANGNKNDKRIAFLRFQCDFAAGMRRKRGSPFSISRIL